MRLATKVCADGPKGHSAERPHWAMGHFRDYQVGANCIVLLIVLCLWEGGGFFMVFVAKALALVRGLFGRCQDVPCVLATKVTRAYHAAQVHPPPWLTCPLSGQACPPALQRAENLSSGVRLPLGKFFSGCDRTPHMFLRRHVSARKRGGPA